MNEVNCYFTHTTHIMNNISGPYYCAVVHVVVGLQQLSLCLAHSPCELLVSLKRWVEIL